MNARVLFFKNGSSVGKKTLKPAWKSVIEIIALLKLVAQVSHICNMSKMLFSIMKNIS